MIELDKIYNENCLDTMSRVEDNFIDTVLTSPPYNMNLRISGGKYCSRQIVKELSTKYEEFSDNLPIDEFYETHSKIISELIRVSKIVFYNIQIVTGSKRAFFKIIGKFADELKEIIYWDKVNGQPAMSPGVLNAQCEIILVFGDNPISRKFSKSNFQRGSLSNTWAIKRGVRIHKGHGATFPLELAEKVIENFANGLVYDPFMGCGTTAIACKKVGLNFIGSEISEKYCKIARDRILDFSRQTTFF